MIPKQMPPSSIKDYATKVVGVKFVDGYPATIHNMVHKVVYLQRNPANPHDANAIEVHVEPYPGMIGHLPKEDAVWLAPALDAGVGWYIAEIEVIPHAINPGLKVLLVDGTDAHKTGGTWPPTGWPI